MVGSDEPPAASRRAKVRHLSPTLTEKCSRRIASSCGKSEPVMFSSRIDSESFRRFNKLQGE